jgi:hypothetical protein
MCSLVLRTPSNHIDPCVTFLNAVEGVTLFRTRGWAYIVSTGAWRHHAKILCRIGLPARIDEGEGGGQ